MTSRRCCWILLPLLLVGTPLPRLRAEEQKVPSVAVLPFDQLRPDPKDEYLKAGLAETLTLALARVKALQVVERSQISRVLQELKLQNSGLVDPEKAAQIGKQIGAEQMVIGSFVRVGDKMRIICRFVNVQTNQVDPQHNTTLTEGVGPNDEKIFDLLDQLADAVVKGFGVQATAQEQQKIQQVVHATEKPKSLEFYTRGREQFLLGTPEGYREAIKLYDQAIEGDERYALAWAGKAEALQALGFDVMQRGDEDPKPKYRQSLQAAKKAVELGPELSETHRALAWAYSRIGDEGDSEIERRGRCERAARKALELNDKDAEANSCLWEALDMPLQGEGYEAIQKCLRLNPRLGIAHNNLAFAYTRAQRFDEALKEMDAALAVSPRNALAVANIGDIYMLKDDYGKAQEYYQKALALEPGCPYALLGTAIMHMKRQQPMEAIPILQKLIRDHPRIAPPYMQLGLMMIMVGNPAGGAQYLRKYIELAADAPQLKESVDQVKQVLQQIGAGW